MLTEERVKIVAAVYATTIAISPESGNFDKDEMVLAAAEMAKMSGYSEETIEEIKKEFLNVCPTVLAVLLDIAKVGIANKFQKDEE